MSTSGTVSTSVSLTDATYARSAAGIKRLQSDFSADIENLIKILNGDKYATFKKTIEQNWTGADAEDFLSDVESTRKTLETNLRELKTKFNNAMDEDAKQFAEFQARNVK